jgi:hypothetical protein
MRMKKRKNYRWKCKERDGIDSDTCISKPNTERKACTVCQHVRKYIYLSISGFIIDPKKVLCWKCHDAKCDSMFEAHMRIIEPDNSAWRGC